MKFFPENFFITDPFIENGEFIFLLQKIIIVLLIGSLIGLEREHSRAEGSKIFAGIRTYTLISLLGLISAIISEFSVIWILPVIFIAFSSLVVASYITSSKNGKVGGTSEIAALLTFLLGALVYWNLILLAAAAAVIITVFLSLKIQLHNIVGSLGEQDIYATLKMAIITIIILPLLPDKTIDPLKVLNPRLIWLMVVLVSGISLLGYLVIKFYGKNKGLAVTGLIGGFISSTAVAFSFSRKSKIQPAYSGTFALGILLASSIMFLRIAVIIFLLNLSLASSLWILLLIFSVFGFIISYYYSKRIVNDSVQLVEVKNPFEIKSALVFGLIFGVILFLSKAAQIYFGNSGIYAASVLGGISSVDAIVLSISKIVNEKISFRIASEAIIIVAATNTIVKLIIASIWGDKKLKEIVIRGLGLLILIQLLVLFFLVIKI